MKKHINTVFDFKSYKSNYFLRWVVRTRHTCRSCQTYTCQTYTCLTFIYYLEWLQVINSECASYILPELRDKVGFFLLSSPQLCKWSLYQSVFILDIKNVDRRGTDKIYKSHKAAINSTDWLALDSLFQLLNVYGKLCFSFILSSRSSCQHNIQDIWTY